MLHSIKEAGGMISVSGFDVGARVVHLVRLDVWAREGNKLAYRWTGRGNMQLEEAVEAARGSRVIVLEAPDERKGFRLVVAKNLFPVFHMAGALYQRCKCLLPETETLELSPDFIRKSGCGWKGSPTSGKADEWIEAWYRNLYLPSLGLTKAEIDKLLKSGEALGSVDKKDAGLSAVTALKLVSDQYLRRTCGLDSAAPAWPSDKVAAGSNGSSDQQQT